MKRKTLNEMTIKDNFMFGAVMLEPELCRKLLEVLLEIPIAEVRVDKEKCLVYHPEYHGVRLDVYASDENHTYYNVEMQVKNAPVARRARYYASQMDMDFIGTAESYEDLPNSYVIFICDFDPLGAGKYKYVMTTSCMNHVGVNYSDGRNIIILNTKGTDDTNVSEELLQFLKYVREGVDAIAQTPEGSYVRTLQEKIDYLKSDREIGVQYMGIHEMFLEERAEGRVEGRTEGKRMAKAEDIRLLIKSTNFTQEEAMRVLGIPQEEQAEYLELLEENQ